MSGPALDPNARINLSKARLLLIDGNEHAIDLLGKMARGLGFQDVTHALTAAEANAALKREQIDLIVTEARIGEDDAYGLIRDLRRSADNANRYCPVIVTQGHVRPEDVANSRDAGANFVLLKPITPQVLLQRILWVLRDKRNFVEAPNYVGPDRRFKFEGPPIGSDGRRKDDVAPSLSAESGENMSQSELAELLKPQKVVL